MDNEILLNAIILQDKHIIKSVISENNYTGQWSMLSIVIEDDDVETLQLLITTGNFNKWIDLAIIESVYINKIKVFRWMFANGHIKDPNYYMLQACCFQSNEIITFLRKKNVIPSTVDMNILCQQGNYEMVFLLIDYVDDSNLHLAYYNDQFDVVKLLISVVNLNDTDIMFDFIQDEQFDLFELCLARKDFNPSPYYYSDGHYDEIQMMIALHPKCTVVNGYVKQVQIDEFIEKAKYLLEWKRTELLGTYKTGCLPLHVICNILPNYNCLCLWEKIDILKSLAQ